MVELRSSLLLIISSSAVIYIENLKELTHVIIMKSVLPFVSNISVCLIEL